VSAETIREARLFFVGAQQRTRCLPFICTVRREVSDGGRDARARIVSASRAIADFVNSFISLSDFPSLVCFSKLFFFCLFVFSDSRVFC